ncbi:serine palmitoyltransferase 3 [Dermatophagoides farinae]|uniref:serine palmitoyltransferase 3 n=1 Tax=Dermatophagoides farinae TaxID=6954 RepID=UPI003F64880A
MVASDAGFEICSDNEHLDDGHHKTSCFNQKFDENFRTSTMMTTTTTTTTATAEQKIRFENGNAETSTTTILRQTNDTIIVPMNDKSNSVIEIPNSYSVSYHPELSPVSLSSSSSNSLFETSLLSSPSSSSSFLDPYYPVNNYNQKNHHYDQKSYRRYKSLHKRTIRRRKIIHNDDDDDDEIECVNRTTTNTNGKQQQQQFETKIIDSIQTRDKYYSSDPRSMIEPSIVIRFLCYFSYMILVIFGYFRMFMEWLNLGDYNTIIERNRKDYRPLYNSWQAFFTRYIYRRVADIFAIPITGNPGGIVTVLERESNDRNFTFQLTGKQFDCINLASYDYLGFSRQSSSDPSIEQAIRKYGVGINAIHEIGMLDLHRKLEQKFAEFLQVESCIVFGMGFATNSTNIPSLADNDCLILADCRSHASAKSGIYLSGATFDYFKHNDCNDLEQKICNAILYGHHGKPWKKIIIIVEGVYSMEGTIVDLPRLIELKQKYKCYLYVDEAHSIGAVGPNGRGIVDYFGCDPKDVDLLMGTMTKSFAAAGGYLAGGKQLIDHIRQHSLSNYAGSISAPIAQQIINTLSILLCDRNNIIDTEGQRRIQQLLSNTHYMRDRLRNLGFVIAGHYDSPVIPIMIYIPAKIGSVVRMAVKNGLALVCAGYPATSLTTNRIRLCMTAQHSRETLDQAIRILSMIGDVHHIKYQRYGVL